MVQYVEEVSEKECEDEEEDKTHDRKIENKEGLFCQSPCVRGKQREKGVWGME